jgi:hypothetical protein
MFQICVPNKKVQGEKPMLQILKKILNVMIRNIKIHNICNINEITKPMEPNKCIHNFFLQNCLFKCFINDFSKIDGPKETNCDVPSCTTQGWACPPK